MNDARESFKPLIRAIAELVGTDDGRYAMTAAVEVVNAHAPTIAEAIRAPLQSRLEAYETCFRSEADELHNLASRLHRRYDDQFSQDIARALLKRVARLRELSESREA